MAAGEMIDRAPPTVIVQVSNITASSFIFTATSSEISDKWDYSLDNGSWLSFSTQETSSVSLMIGYLSPNTSHTIRVKARRKSDQVEGASALVNVTTLGCSSITRVENFTVDSPTSKIRVHLSISDSSYLHTLTISKGGSALVTFSGISGDAGNTTRWLVLSPEQRNAIMAAMSSEAEGVLTYVLTSYDTNSAVVGTSTAEGQANISEASAPVVNGINPVDINSAVVTITGNNSVFVQNQSSLRVTVTATASYGTSIAKYSVTVGSKTVESTSRIIDFGTVDANGSVCVTVEVFDRRGYKASHIAAIPVEGYRNITLDSWSVARQNNVDTTIELSFTGSFSSVKVGGVEKNALTVASYRCKRSTDVSYGDSTSILNAVSVGRAGFSFEGTPLRLPIANAYHVELTVSDAFTSSTVVLYVSKAKPLVSFRSERVGINTNDPQSALDVEGEIRMNGRNVMGVVSDNLDADTDLNDITDAGIYFNLTEGTLDRHFPVANATGLLEVFTGRMMVYQRYTNSATGFIYTRACVIGMWSPWTAN